MAERWWILDGGFRWSPAQGGSLFSGPFSTRDDALEARATIEKMDPFGMTYCIEREPVSDVLGSDA